MDVAPQGTRGLPGEMMLLFAVLLWVFFLAILLSNPHNRTNVWCFAGGMVFSIGIWKEYLFYTLGPALLANGVWTPAFSEGLYSVLSAVFYDFSMPTMMIFGLYFSELDIRCPKQFRFLQVLCYVLALALFLRIPCTEILQYQSVPAYCLAVGLYNWAFGAVFLALLLHTLHRERLSARYRQRRIAARCILLPLTYWLVSAFPWHIFGITSMLKAWQGNLAVVALLLVYLLYHMFRGGIWGIRLRKESYDWTSGAKVMQMNARYVGHTLKGELAKIQWCAARLRESGVSARELEMMESSVAHLQRFVQRTQLYSNEIVLTPAECDVAELFQEVADRFLPPEGKDISIRVGRCEQAPLRCDRAHLAEVLQNLVANAADAIEGRGTITLSYRVLSFQKAACLTVSDDGCGITPEQLAQLFEPYYTGKAAGHHLGLGLYYCWNVMESHGGRIQVQTAPGRGSDFTLWFPVRRRRRERGG